MANDQVNLIQRKLAADAADYPFESLVFKVFPSLIAIACGKQRDGLINAIGTGFAIENSSNDGQTLFCTCEHIVENVFAINSLKREEGEKNGLLITTSELHYLRIINLNGKL